MLHAHGKGFKICILSPYISTFTPTTATQLVKQQVCGDFRPDLFLPSRPIKD